MPPFSVCEISLSSHVKEHVFLCWRYKILILFAYFSFDVGFGKRVTCSC